jgi:protein gp37
MTPNGTAIEWTHRPGTKGETWNPIAGCAIVSPGCIRCYAMRMARRIELMSSASKRDTHYAGTTRVVNGNPVWTGKVAVAPDDVWEKPLRWKSPRTIFVNSMSDLFHPAVTDEGIDRVFATAALTPQHVYIILTKRSDRMRAYMNGFTCDGARRFHIADAAGRMVEDGDNAHDWVANAAWPLPNVWLGVSAERQQEADERREDLRTLAGAGWTTFVSYEPALGPVDWSGWEFLKQLIAGGESGPQARPGHPDWYRAARDFAAAHGIAFFFKQWGAWHPLVDRDRDDPDWRKDYSISLNDSRPDIAWLNLAGGRGFHGERFHIMHRLGKKTAGRMLDGVEHSAFPAVSP